MSKRDYLEEIERLTREIAECSDYRREMELIEQRGILSVKYEKSRERREVYNGIDDNYYIPKNGKY